jgi:hypothetical protein
MPTPALDIESVCQAVVEALVGPEPSDPAVRATQDPAEVNTPGAWVTWEGFQVVTLGGTVRHLLAVYLVVEDRDWRRATRALSDLYNEAVPALITPDGPVVPQRLVLPGTPTELPALRVPVHLTTT